MNELAKTEPTPQRQWSTQEIKPAQRFDYWVGAICEAFLEMDCSSREAAVFDGQLTSVPVENLSFNQVLSSPADVYRTQSAIGRGKQAPFYLITQLHNPWHVRQGGHVVHLRAGDTVLVDSEQCYELHFPEAAKLMSVQLPRQWVGQWLAQMHSKMPRVAAKDVGWGQSLSALCVQLGHDPMLAASYPQSLLSDQLGAMLSASLEPTQKSIDKSSLDLAQRATSLIKERLDQHGLAATEIAEQLSISVRTLHRSFAAHNSTFASTLRSLRLERAAQMLVQARLSGVSIAEIGRRCGFADASHFVREFALIYRCTPALWRKQHLPG